MAFSEGSWIQGLLLAAKEDLAYCKFILDFEKKSGKNYNASINIDQFYKRVSVLSFNDALLIVASLLDGSEDQRPVNFINWDRSKDNVEIDKIRRYFNASPLSGIRDRMLAHQDSVSTNLFIINSRRWGIVATEYVMMLDDVLELLIQAYVDIENAHGARLDAKVTFDVTATIQEINDVMSKAPPHLTPNMNLL